MMKGRTRTERDWQFEGYCELISKVYRQALREARRGNLAAMGWLDIVAPDWRTLQHSKHCKRGKRESVA